MTWPHLVWDNSWLETDIYYDHHSPSLPEPQLTKDSNNYATVKAFKLTLSATTLCRTKWWVHDRLPDSGPSDRVLNTSLVSITPTTAAVGNEWRLLVVILIYHIVAVVVSSRCNTEGANGRGSRWTLVWDWKLIFLIVLTWLWYSLHQFWFVDCADRDGIYVEHRWGGIQLLKVDILSKALGQNFYHILTST